MATAIPFEMVFQTVAGAPVSGVKVYTYAPGTTTPRTVYSDTGLTVPVANPFIGNSAGYAAFYLSSDMGYRIVARSADDSITYYDQEIPAASAELFDATTAAIAALNFASGDIMEATGVDTFRTRKFQTATYASARLLTGLTLGDAVFVNGRAALRDGGEGWFTVAGAGADNDGITLVMADSKALIRNNIQESIDADWFGIIPGTVNVTDWNAMVATVALQSTRTVELRGGTYTFPSKPSAITTILRLKGQGSSVTVLERGYSEAGGDEVAFIEFQDAGASNSGIADLQLRPASGTTGGTMLRLYTTTTSILSWCDMEACVITPNTGDYVIGLIVDGRLNTTSGSQGVRNFRSQDSFVFAGASGRCFEVYNSTNGFHSGLWCNGDVLVSGGGSALTNTQDWRMVGCDVHGEMTIENCNRIYIDGAINDVTIASSATNVMVNAANRGGTFANSSTSATIFSQNGQQGGPSPYAAFAICRQTVNMNITTDQALTISLPPGFSRYRFLSIIMTGNAAASSAVGGIYTGASKSGTDIVAASQGYTAITGNNTNQALTITAPGVQVMNDLSLFFSLTTAHGSASTAELLIIAYPIV